MCFLRRCKKSGPCCCWVLNANHHCKHRMMRAKLWNTVAVFEQVHKIVFYFSGNWKKLKLAGPSLLIMRVAVGEKRGKGLFAKEKKKKEPNPWLRWGRLKIHVRLSFVSYLNIWQLTVWYFSNQELDFFQLERLRIFWSPQVLLTGGKDVWKSKNKEKKLRGPERKTDNTHMWLRGEASEGVWFIVFEPVHA